MKIRIVNPAENGSPFTTNGGAAKLVRKGRAIWVTLNESIRILTTNEKVVTATGRATSHPKIFKVYHPGRLKIIEPKVIRDGSIDLMATIPFWPSVKEIKKRDERQK